MSAIRSPRLFAIVSLLLPLAAQALPPGSYQESCRGIDIRPSGRGYLLTAECRTDNGQWKYVSMDWDEANRCKGLINTNGNLICPEETPGLPGGSYSKSCKEITLHNDLVRALCLTEKGHWKPTYYPLKDYPCPKGLANRNGMLVCE